MKKNYIKNSWTLVCLLSFLHAFISEAQVNTYGFSASSGTYTPLVGATSSGLAATSDDNLSAALPIGFTFVYNGISYTTFKVNSNGAMFFGTGNSGGGNNLATTTASYRPGLAPLWDDLQCTEGIKYQLNGVAPNQTLTVEWKNMEWRYDSGTPVISFQVILHETSNQIDYVYQQEATAVVSGSASIGLMGTTPTDYISLQGTGTNPTRSTTTSTNSLNTKPATGQVYSWIAAPATPPTPTETAGSPNCVTGTSFEIAGSPASGVTWYVQSSATGTSTANPFTSPYNVLNNGTYYVRAYNSAFDAWSVASSSIAISSIPVAATPPSPIATVEPSCVTTGSELTVPLTGNSDITYYWQGTTMNGFSTTDVAATDLATTPYIAPASGTYYVSAYDASTSCWSPTSSVTVTVQTAVPAAPTASVTEYNICGGLSNFDITASAPLSANTTTETIPSGALNIAIPDNSATGITNNLIVSSIPPGAVVTGLAVTLNITHPFDGDLDISLMGANGTTIELSTDNGSTGDNYINTVLSSSATNLITGGTAPFTGTYRPEGNLSSLFSVANGTWSLIVSDDGSGDIGTLVDWTLQIIYSSPAQINWYDATTAGSQIGTGSPFDCIGNSVLADPSSNGSYDFYAETLDGACPSATRTLVTVNVLDVNVVITPIDETCIGYANGSFEISDTLCGATPFLVDVDGGGFGAIPTNLTPGTYTITVQDAAMNESAPTMITIGTASSYIPDAPTASVSLYNVCSGETSQMIEAVSGGSGMQSESSGTLNINIPDNNATGVSSDLIISGIPAGATITDISVTVNISHTWTSDIDIKLTGPNSTTIDLSSDNGGISGPGYVNTVISSNGVTPINGATAPMTGVYAAEGNMLSLLSILNGTWKLNVSDDSSGDNGTFQDWSISISYSLPPGDIEWYDAASNGNLEGTGSPFESIGTNVLPSPATSGTYEFYAGALADGCYSTSRTLVTVSVNDVNVELTAIDITCNNAATGSFDISDTLCGTAPFLVDIDGGGFGPIPTNLIAGTYQVTIQDDNGEISPVYTLIINEAGAPSDAYMEVITDNGGQVSWNANGNETEWNVEWGLPGFTPGTGTEIGSTQATDTFAIITGLDANTNYDVYVSANCGAGSTTGGWDMVNWTTDCGIYGLPFVETFEDNSDTRVCWSNEYEVDNADWTYQTGSSGGAITTAYEGSKNARFVSVTGTDSPVTKLASPRFDFTGQDSVAVIFAYAQEAWLGDQNKTKVYTSGASASWTEIASYTTSVSSWTVDTLYIADTTVQIAFEGINNFGRANVIDYVQFMPCSLTPGTDGTIDVCRLDGTFDLNTVITKGEDFGTWSFDLNPTLLNGSIVNLSALPNGTYEFHYIVKTPCAVDTTTATLSIFPPSSAGVDGSITACRNEPIYLLSGLSGNVDLGGQWYNTSNNPINVNVTTSNLPGNYNFDYIVSNGICPNDTANILVTVGTCDYLDVQELVFGDMNVYPNPTEDLVFITTGSSETFSYELLDVKGQLLSSKEAAINGTKTTEISFEKLEPGIYMIRVYNSEAEKTFRIVKQ